MKASGKKIKTMRSYESRSKFLNFFKSKKHELIPSDTLVPKNDTTLLFTSAGMNQFKEQFIGKNITFKRAASCQKCLRTGDLENVGNTSGHHTFFEMLGNFSFGDYFKKEACIWAWEFMTKELKIPVKGLWVSVYKEDNEAYDIWSKIVGVKKNRIIRFGAKDNFWPSDAPSEGPDGPCGPCSEIFYDWGKKTGCKKKDCNPSCGCGRFIEVWNLVFTQFNRVGKNKLEPLPSKNIDTGMGLERITAVMSGVKTNFQTDLFVPVIEEIKSHTQKLKAQEVNAIADHLRAAVFAICDGVSPSNEERGYVVRKLIRRAYRFSKSDKPFLYNLVQKIVKVMRDTYPLLRSRRDDIAQVIKEEEDRFQHTLTQALPKLDEVISEGRKTRMIPGKAIFRLVDTYGLPLDVIEERAKKSKCRLDKKGFDAHMNKRKELSRKKSKIDGNIFVEGVFSKAPRPATSGADPLGAEIIFMAKGHSKVQHAGEGERVSVLTNPQSSAFYAEAGGQVGDAGGIEKPGARLEILGTYRQDERVIHDCIVRKGKFNMGDTVILVLDKTRNVNIAKNHTATHLIHSALRKVLGEHVHQSGSLVDDKRLRFDFTHVKKLSTLEIERVEDFVNENIRKSINVNKETKTRVEAESEGAIALFGEKYGAEVRVISIGDVSKELCGGTHVGNTGEISLFKIISESSIASGIRRIDAVAGGKAVTWIKKDIDKLLAVYSLDEEALRKYGEVKLITEKLAGTIAELKALKNGEVRITQEKLRVYSRRMKPGILDAIEFFERFKKKIEKVKKAKYTDDIKKRLDEIVKKSGSYKGAKVVVADLEKADMNSLRDAVDILRNRVESAFIALASVKNERANMVVAFTDAVERSGLDASSIIKEAAKVMDGSGGGRKNFAQAGGRNVLKVKKALARAKELFFETY